MARTSITDISLIAIFAHGQLVSHIMVTNANQAHPFADMWLLSCEFSIFFVLEDNVSFKEHTLLASRREAEDKAGPIKSTFKYIN